MKKLILLLFLISALNCYGQVKISALPELGEAPATGDILALTDISANVTKKVTVLELLRIGASTQAYDADLTTYAGITPAADMQSFLAAANDAAARTALGVSASVVPEALPASGTLVANTHYYEYSLATTDTWTLPAGAEGDEIYMDVNNTGAASVITFSGTQPVRTLEGSIGTLTLNNSYHQLRFSKVGTVWRLSDSAIDTETANLIYAGPVSGGAAVPTFRAMVAADIAADIIDGAALADTIALDANLAVNGAFAIALGNNLGTVAINSSAWDITATGVMTGSFDFGGATDLEMLNAAAPSALTAAGEFHLDTNLLTGSTGQGIIQYHDGVTAALNVVSTTDTPGDNEIPKFDSTTGTITWEADSTGAGLGTSLSSGTNDILSSTATTGAIVLGSNAIGAAEALTLDFGTTANTVGASSTTGVTDLDLGTIDLGTDTLDLTGTGTINGLDAIDATTETTLEAALDLAGDVTATGLGNTLIAADVVDGAALADTLTLDANLVVTGAFSHNYGNNLATTVTIDTDGTGDAELVVPDQSISSTEILDATIAAADLAVGAQTDAWVVAISDETTALTTGTAKVTFRAPYAATVTGVRLSTTTANTGATLLTVDINETAVSILSTKLTTDASEKTSTTAATAAVISDSAIASDAEITIDIDAVGNTIAGAGAKVYIIHTH